MTNKYFGEILVSEEGGLFPGWVVVRFHPVDTPGVQEFQVRVSCIMSFIREKVGTAAALVWVKRRKRGETRSYTIWGKRETNQCEHPQEDILLHVCANVQFYFLPGGIPSIASVDYNGAVEDKGVYIECRKCGKVVHPEIPIKELTPELAQKLLREED